MASACILAFSIAFQSAMVIFGGSGFFSGCGAVCGLLLLVDGGSQNRSC